MCILCLHYCHINLFITKILERNVSNKVCVKGEEYKITE